MKLSIRSLVVASAVLMASLFGSFQLTAYLVNSGISTRTYEERATGQVRNLSKYSKIIGMTLERFEKRHEPKKFSFEVPDVEALELEEMLANSDPWGNTIHYRRLPSGELGFYSCGNDGVSQTEGEDADDISSWNGRGSYYVIRDIGQRIGTTLLFLTCCAIVLGGCYDWRREIRRLQQRDVESVTRSTDMTVQNPRNSERSNTVQTTFDRPQNTPRD